MIDKMLEGRIAQLNEFLGLWTSFYESYKRAVNQQTFSDDEEKKFLELKSNLARKYQAVMDTLGIKPTAEDRTFDVISQVMSLKSIPTLSPLQIQKMESDWHNSYITLNKILGSLENKKVSLAKISVLSEMSKKIFANPFFVLVLILVIISIVYYGLQQFF